MPADRLAIYGFAYVPAFEPRQRKLPADALPRGAERLDLFRRACKALTHAGYTSVGMDPFAAPTTASPCRSPRLSGCSCATWRCPSTPGRAARRPTSAHAFPAPSEAPRASRSV